MLWKLILFMTIYTGLNCQLTDYKTHRVSANFLYKVSANCSESNPTNYFKESIDLEEFGDREMAFLTVLEKLSNRYPNRSLCKVRIKIRQGRSNKETIEMEGYYEEIY